MPRQPRIQYENAFYHVMNRGKARQVIFPEESYFRAFLQTLGEANKRFDAVIHAYCLMGNHYHLLIETPRANLDRIMRHINGIYTQRYNRLKRSDGPLFRGRYKAILVDRDAYLLQLSRYIHRNPIETKRPLVDLLEDYPWSSYPAYINTAKAPSWLTRETTYQMLGRRQKYSGYRRYVGDGNVGDISEFYGKGNVATVVGGLAFKEHIAENAEDYSVNTELAKVLNERPSPEAIVKAVSHISKVSIDTIVKRQPGRQQANQARKIAIYLCQRVGDMPLKDIAGYFGLSSPSSVSPALADIKKLFELGELELKPFFKALNYLQ